jgi:hypothetical protein
LAAESADQIADIVTRAAEEQTRRRLIQRFNGAYSRLKANPAAWAAYKAETEQWDATLGDGLDPSDDWSDRLAAGPDGLESVDEGDDAASRSGLVGNRVHGARVTRW